MVKKPGQRRDFGALETRRLKAAELFARGFRPAEVARAVKVSRQSSSLWYRQWLQNGEKALRAAGRAGRKPKLDERQLSKVSESLKRGAEAHGFATNLWTLPRVAAVIKVVTGVAYHPGHVWRLLGQLDWTRQRPARRAAERNDEQIERWRTEKWPEVKKTPDVGTRGSSSRTKPVSRSGRPSDKRGPRKGRPQS